MKTIKLVNPIKVNGKDVKELPFDTSTYGMAEHKRANKIAAEQNMGVYVPAQENDYNYHLAIAQIIIEKTSNGEISIEDLSRVTGTDLFRLQGEGRNFLFESVQQSQESSDAPSETTA
jgi:hypothetical protein